MNWVVLAFALEIGFMPISDFVVMDNTTRQHAVAEAWYAQTETEIVLWDHIFVGGDFRVEMQRGNEQLRFLPYAGNWLTYTGVRFGPIEMGFRHRSVHPVISYTADEDGLSYAFDGGYEEVYLRFEGEL